MPSIMGSDNPGPGALPTFQADVTQSTRVREFQGSAGQETANVFGALSNTLNQWRDRAVEDVGKQQGDTLGQDPSYRPDADESLMGIARRNAANATYGNNLEASARNSLGDAYEQYSQLPADQRTPQRLQQMIGGIKQDFDQNHVFDQVSAPFNKAFAGLAYPLIRQAQSDADARQQDAAKASFLTNQNSARDTAIRVASLPSANDADVVAAVKQHDAAVDEAVNNGVYSSSQAVQLKDGFKQDVLQQRVLARFQSLPDAQKPAFLESFRSGFGGANTPGGAARNNNPGNIIDGDWAKSQPGYSGANGRFAVFDSPENGAAAMSTNLRSYARQGVTTLNQLTAKWAPSGDGANNPAAYAATISRATGIDPNAKIDLTDQATLNKIMPAMAQVEQGHAVAFKGQGQTSGLSADTVSALDGKMSSSVRALQGQAGHAQKLALGDIGGDLKQIESGYDVPDDEWAAKRAQYSASPDATVSDAFHTADAIRTMYSGFKGKPPADVDAEVSSLKAQLAQGATPQQARLAEAADKYAGRLRQQFDANPLGRAAADGIIPGVVPLDTSSPGALAQTLRARVAAADQVQQHYGLARSPMTTPDDREALKSVAAAGGERMVQTAATIAQTLGPRAGQFFSEIGGDAPSFAHMGVLAASGGDPGLLRDAAWTTAQDHQQGGKVQRPAPELLQQEMGAQFGDAFRAIPTYAEGAKLVAGSALAAQVAREGLDPKSMSGAIVDQTLQKAAGATYVGGVQYGGVANAPIGFWGSQKVLAPSSVRADQLGAVVRAIGDKDLASLPSPPKAADGTVMPAAALSSLHFTSLGPGVYALSKGDPNGEDPQWVTYQGGQRGNSGRFTLDLNALEPALRARVPGAYK